MYNNRKRAQTASIAPSHEIPGPSGDAHFSDLMPTGGFPGQRSCSYGNKITTRGAANSNGASGKRGVSNQRGRGGCQNNRDTNRGARNTGPTLTQRKQSPAYINSVTGPMDFNAQCYQNSNTQKYNQPQPHQRFQQTYMNIERPSGSRWSGNNGNTQGRFSVRSAGFCSNSRVPPVGAQRGYGDMSLRGGNRAIVSQRGHGQATVMNAVGAGNYRPQYSFNSVAFNEYNPYAGGDNNAQFSYMDYSTAEAEPADEWDTSFEEEATIQTSKPMVQQKKTTFDPKIGPYFFTANIAGIKRWNKLKDNVQMLFEVYGVLDSAVWRRSEGCKEFLLRDENQDTVKCVFFEISIDNNLTTKFCVRGLAQWLKRK